MVFTIIVIGSIVVCAILVQVSRFVPASNRTSNVAPTEAGAFSIKGKAAAKGVNEYEAATKYIKALMDGDRRVSNLTMKRLDPQTGEPIEGAEAIHVTLNPEGCVGWNIISPTGEALSHEGETVFRDFKQAITACPEGCYLQPVFE